jgi:hypothetical protein
LHAPTVGKRDNPLLLYAGLRLCHPPALRDATNFQK